MTITCIIDAPCSSGAVRSDQLYLTALPRSRQGSNTVNKEEGCSTVSGIMSIHCRMRPYFIPATANTQYAANFSFRLLPKRKRHFDKLCCAEVTIRVYVMTFEQVVETSVTVTTSPFKDFTPPDNRTESTCDTTAGINH